MKKSYEEFERLFVEQHRKLFESELGLNGQFDELICIAYDEYLTQEAV